jgi:hypothetical protein
MGAGVWGPPPGNLVIGVEMDQERIEADLNAALLTDAEMETGPSAWANLQDPFRALLPERLGI